MTIATRKTPVYWQSAQSVARALLKDRAGIRDRAAQDVAEAPEVRTLARLSGLPVDEVARDVSGLL